MKRVLAALLAAATVSSLAACSLDSKSQSADTVDVVIGYQSKTINTVTAGTLLKAKGFLEQRLADIGKSSGKKYNVVWQDYDTGAPITAQMVAEKIDIGSMGDYPLLINGSKTQANERAKTELVSITGYSPTGALNMVVVPPNSPARTITDLKGEKVSASVGSAGHGTLVRALDTAGLDPKAGVAQRACFIVDPENIIRFAYVTDLSVGRNPQEVLRVLDALQTDELCPCNWNKGEATLTV